MTKLHALLLPLKEVLTKTQLKQLMIITAAALAMTSRLTMLGISRWTENGGSYRTIQRFFMSYLPWEKLNFLLLKPIIKESKGVLLIAGDATTVTKSGKSTFGVSKFYSSLFNRPVPALSFQALSLIDTEKRQAWPLIFKQIIKTKKESKKNSTC